MKKHLLVIAALFTTSLLFAQGQFQNETAGSLSFVSGQVMQLAEAISEDTYAWTPQEGVRSVAEVCAHIISANYFFASKLGATIPADVNMQTLEKDLKTKEAISKELKRSYETMIGAIRNTKDADLAKKVEFPFPGEFTSMSAILIALGHSNEHLGQLIAYARSNKITPPWSQGNN
ncbi:MAG: DinB family protein [Cyclobacteriaceae bacterium]